LEGEATPLFGPAPPRTPPNAVEAEQALLGSLLCNNARTMERCQFLKPEHFADPIHGMIFKRATERIAGGAAYGRASFTTSWRGHAPEKPPT
jgi:replicative DNA helicase